MVEVRALRVVILAGCGGARIENEGEDVCFLLPGERHSAN